MTANVYADQADALEMSRLRREGRCTLCAELKADCECTPLPRTRAINHSPFEPPDLVDDESRVRLTEDDE
jgi:hypothetical protein